jgi:hypothetical protein
MAALAMRYVGGGRGFEREEFPLASASRLPDIRTKPNGKELPVKGLPTYAWTSYQLMRG